MWLFSLLTQVAISERNLRAGIVGINFDVIVIYAVSRQKRNNAVRCEPAAVNDALKHCFAIRKHASCRLANDIIIQNRGVSAVQIPGLKERAPINVFGNLSKIEILKGTAANKLGFRGGVIFPSDQSAVGTSRSKADKCRAFFGCMLLANALILNN